MNLFQKFFIKKNRKDFVLNCIWKDKKPLPQYLWEQSFMFSVSKAQKTQHGLAGSTVESLSAKITV